MRASEHRPLVSEHAEIDRALLDLHAGARTLVASSLDDRIASLQACVEQVVRVAHRWVEAGCAAKRTDDLAAGRAEEVLTGPISTLRFLQLMIGTLTDLQAYGVPRVPGRPRDVAGQLRVPIFPTRLLFDQIVFRGLSAETWLEPDVSSDQLFGGAPARLLRHASTAPQVELVLGAGNVSSIPVTDALTKIFQDDHAVLLKMNPVNDYLGPIIAEALQPLINAGWLRIIYGGSEPGTYAVHHSLVDSVHITGSTETHDAIVWGSDLEGRRQRQASNQPLIQKPITSELGNVTPWIIVPGNYTQRQLHAQAEAIAASITNNGSFNCIATKMLITSKHWPQQTQFLNLVDSILQQTPPRYAYYPGARERFAQFAGRPAPDDSSGRLPWVLRRGMRLTKDPSLFGRESFVCVVGQTSLDPSSPHDFLDQAIDLANDHMSGTLAVSLTVPEPWANKHSQTLDNSLRRLRYGTIGVNQWAGVAFALMAPPWGGYGGADLQHVQSGIGTVHNTCLLHRPQKTVVRAPLVPFPKPVWFSTHRCPDTVAWKLCALYAQPSAARLPGLLWNALRG